MSDVMLLGVLRMPPELWGKGAIDVAQRHGYYRAAADRIEQDAARIQELEKEIQKWHWMMAWCKKNGLPPAQSWVSTTPPKPDGYGWSLRAPRLTRLGHR